MADLTLIEQHQAFGGVLQRYQHLANTTHCRMTFSIYLPEKAIKKEKVPCIFFLSGLTCTDENFPMKAGAFSHANDLSIALVIADTSPRGDQVPNYKDDTLGQGAGFYVNATQAPWNQHFQMYDYIVDELPNLVFNHFPLDEQKQSIMGHSMGGHGALMIALKNLERYRCVSAFAPIVNPSQTPWGQQALTLYLGEDENAWQQYDSLHCLNSATKKIPILIHQGLKDVFYPNEINPEPFVHQAQRMHFPIRYEVKPDYDHGYYFVSSFIHEHLLFHAHYFNILNSLY